MSAPQCKSILHVSFRILFCVALVAITMLAPIAQAQVTTGNLAGDVTTKEDGSALPGVTIEALHVPTGTRYAAVTGGNGRYSIPNVRVGGPYSVTANLEGFQPATKSGVEVALGTTAEIDLALGLAGVSEQITVTAEADIVDPSRAGSASTVSEGELELLPTVNRSLQDFARTNPYVTSSLTGDGTFMFVAGRNNRYNNIQIDGAVNNDLFGLSSSGTPGGGSGTQPIPLDALQQLQLVISPYDVRQSGFTGGGINAVTRNGTNDLEGSLWGAMRDPAFVGEGIFETEVKEFEHNQWGGRIGGPIVRDRLFYFVSGESNRRKEPDDTSADGSTGTVYAGSPSAAELRDYLIDTYGFDPGSLGDLVFNTESDMLFGRLDANIGTQHNLTVRHNWVNGVNDNPPSSQQRSRTRFYYPTNIYSFPSETNSTVLQLNSVFTASSFNEARVGYQTIREHRETGVIFPTVEIGGGERSGTIQTGIERFSGANALDQDILEVTDDFTFLTGNHTIVVGTSNQMYDFANTFIQDFYGYYHFANFDAFKAGTPDVYRIGFATGDDPRRPTAFEAAQYSLYASDRWDLNRGLTLTMGLRADKPAFGTDPSYNPLVDTAIGYDTSTVPSEDITWEPRLGFNWDIGETGRQQLRGGIGVFQGRTPFVWISNNYGNTGVEQLVLGCETRNNCTPPAFNPDPYSQPRDVGAGGVPSVNLSDPDFQFPRILRSTLGYDRELFWGIRGTAELLWSQTQQDVFYYNVNRVQTGTSPLDGRPTYARISNQLSDALLLSNTDKGEDFTQTLQLSKRIGRLSLNTSYTHQDAKSVFDYTSSTAGSNWGNALTEGDIFKQKLTRSTFEVEHRVNFASSYNFDTGMFSHGLGLFYVAQSGQPYSLFMGGDVNRDGGANNDLLYIPAPGSYILCPSNAGSPNATNPCGNRDQINVANFENFLRSVGLNPEDEGIVERNALDQPWTRRLDFHYELGLPAFAGARVSIETDILNVLNLIDNEYGVQRFVNFNSYQPVTYTGIDPTSGKPVYREASSGRLTPGNQYSTANLYSRWQGRLGVRVNF